MLEELFNASDNELLSILAEADDLDEAILERRLQPMPLDKSARDCSLEVMTLGSLGCQLGMLRGEAGGFLLRVAGACLLVDPGPAAVYFLSRLAKEGKFLFGDLSSILCSHVHADHVTDLLPCIEGMTCGMQVRRGCVVGNRTVIEKFTAFSPYHLAMVQPIALTPGLSEEREKVTQGRGKLLRSSIRLDGMDVWATPTFHLEEDGKWDTGIGFFIQSQAANVWYTSDTNLFDGLLRHIKALAAGQRLVLVIANADASDVKHKPGKTRVRHLVTRDILEIARELQPRYILIQHYDEAYSSSRYRIAQAIYVQRLINRLNLETIILPSANGLHLSFDQVHLQGHQLHFESDAGAAVQEHIQALGYA